MPSYVKRHVRKSQAERRQEIIEAAITLLGEYGLEGTTVSRIADAVGLTPGALYRHFESREAILKAANEAAGKQAMSWLGMSAKPDVIDRFEELAAGHSSWTRDHLSTVVRPFFEALGFSRQEELAESMTLPRIFMHQAIIDLAEEGKRQGTIRSDIKSEDVAWTMLGFAWLEDIALMLGAEEAIKDGVFARNLKRMLDSFRPEAAQTGS